MATMATMGQGKTEFCRQLAKSRDLHDCTPGVGYLRCFHVSFNQCTSYSTDEATEYSIEQSLCWRLGISAIGFDGGLSQAQLSNYRLSDLIEGILFCLKAISSTAGVLIAIDEFLKISDVENQKLLLAQISSIQLYRLGNEEPVFFLVTSLVYSMSMIKFKTECGGLCD